MSYFQEVYLFLGVLLIFLIYKIDNYFLEIKDIFKLLVLLIDFFDDQLDFIR